MHKFSGAEPTAAEVGLAQHLCFSGGDFISMRPVEHQHTYSSVMLALFEPHHAAAENGLCLTPKATICWRKVIALYAVDQRLQ